MMPPHVSSTVPCHTSTGNPATHLRSILQDNAVLMTCSALSSLMIIIILEHLCIQHLHINIGWFKAKCNVQSLSYKLRKAS